MRSRGSSGSGSGSGGSSDRRRTDRDAELRRRRYRQLSTSERISRISQQFDADSTPVLARSASTSSSSTPNPSAATPPLTSPFNPFSLFGPLSGPATATPDDDASANTTMAGASSTTTRQPPPPTRSISFGGTRPTATMPESISDRYNRTMAEVQEQLDSMRALLGGNLADETRSSLASATESLNQERDEIEEEFFRFMEDVGDVSAQGWAGRRRAVVSGTERSRKQDAASALLSANGYNAREAERIRKTAAFAYSRERQQAGSDVWPDMRDPAKTPARFRPVELGVLRSTGRRSPGEPSASHTHTTDWMIENDSTTIVWPMNSLPSEIYYLIAESLSRDDIKAMRLTCKEMEHHLSCILFRTVVVPFNTEIYGMLHGLSVPKVDVKAKGKAKAVEFWKNSKDEDIYTGYGVDVFRSFGPRMRRFGMTFEVDEEVLANPPLKGTREDHKSYWGVYQWPYPEYKRFDQVAGLEDAADETPKMKTAFSFLTQVQELALSIDAGLGWLNGPDKSVRTRVLGDQRDVFGKTHPVPDRKEEARRWLWAYLKGWATSTGLDLRHCMMALQKLTNNPNEFSDFTQDFATAIDPVMPFLDLQGLFDPAATGLPLKCIVGADAMARVESTEILPATQSQDAAPPFENSFEGGLLLVKEESLELERMESYPIIPAELTKLQKEWLLETEWAQRAFLSSWLIAVVDNRLTFQHVHTVNFARISSRFLLSLCREDLWRALPQLQKVVLNVVPDCRDVTKDNAGFVETPRVQPIAAMWLLHKLVSEMFSLRASIKTLELGWADGGERASGLLACNKHLMPAPILPPDWLGSAELMADKNLLEQHVLKLPHLKSLTMKNCWITPHALTFLVQEHSGLEYLGLESVSLTAEPTTNNGPNPQQALAIAQQMQGPLLPPHVPAVQPAQLHPGPWNQQAHQTFLQAVQNVNNLAAAAGINIPNQQHTIPSNDDWLHPRNGSWPHVLDAVSPGITLAAAGCTTSPLNIPATKAGHALHTIDLKSAGYCRLNNARLDESAIPPPTYGGGSPWFTKRYAVLSKVMLNTRGGGITAEVVQALPVSEEIALKEGFGMTMGWPEEWDGEADAPTFDACLPGGTGRFCGVISRASRVIVHEE